MIIINTSMLKRKIIKLSSTHTCIIDLAVIMTGISAPLFYLYSCSKLLILFSCLILLSCAYFDYIVAIKLYRYFSHRQVSTTVYRNMSAVHLTTNYSIIFFPFINTFLIIILIMFTNGFIFISFSKEILRAYSLRFENCGNWQVRRVLGILLMLPLPIYALIHLLILVFSF